MRRNLLAAATALLALVLSVDTAAAAGSSWHWTGFGDAPTLYWVVAAGVAAFYLGFVYYVERSPRMVDRDASTKGYVVLGAVMLTFAVGSFGVYVAAGPGMQWGEQPTEDAWDWGPGETLQDPGGTEISGEPFAGYQVAIAQGCFQGGCHTLYVRPEDTAEGHSSLYYPEASEAGDFAEMPVPLWGTQRNGPDLANAGSLKPSMRFQKDHLVDPRGTAPDSIMPSYGYLGDEKLNDLSAFLVTLGQDPDALRNGSAASEETRLSDAAGRGKRVAASEGCTGCHSTDGTPSTGPTWKGLYGSDRELQSGDTVTADEEYLRTAITAPGDQVVKGFPDVMPENSLSDEQVHGLVAYIEALGGEE